MILQYISNCGDSLFFTNGDYSVSVKLNGEYEISKKDVPLSRGTLFPECLSVLSAVMEHPFDIEIVVDLSIPRMHVKAIADERVNHYD